MIDLRDYFAAKAMQVHLDIHMKDDFADSSRQSLIAKWSYEMADAMLIEREKSQLKASVGKHEVLEPIKDMEKLYSSTYSDGQRSNISNSPTIKIKSTSRRD